jgi:hypothetical protein
MLRTICFLVLFASCSSIFCQEQSNEKKQFILFAGMQLSSTKLNACIIAKAYSNKNIFYLGAKTPISAYNIYGYFPAGIISGYGYKLLENEKWKMETVLDLQWLGSKTQNQSKPTHYFDSTINYQLTYIKWKKIQLTNSLGYGCFYKFFYNNYSKKWDKRMGISGLISFGIEYTF